MPWRRIGRSGSHYELWLIAQPPDWEADQGTFPSRTDCGLAEIDALDLCLKSPTHTSHKTQNERSIDGFVSDLVFCGFGRHPTEVQWTSAELQRAGTSKR